MFVVCCLTFNLLKFTKLNHACAFRVVPNGIYTLVPEVGEEGADGYVHYVAVDHDLDQSPEEPKASFTNEGKPQIINPCFI
jgi:hypothetical protein